MDNELEIVISEANKFWDKFGKLTKFKTKEEYVQYATDEYHKFKKKSKTAQNKQMSACQEAIKAQIIAIDNYMDRLRREKSQVQVKDDIDDKPNNNK